MGWLNFHDRSLGVNLAVFGACTIFVWIAGWRIAQYADRFASATGLGHAIVGMIVLAGLTSLPEMAVTFSAALSESPQLAANNLLGSIAMQIAILAVADAMIGRQALTVVAGNSLVLLQVTMNVLLLVLVALAIAVGDSAFAGAGLWSWGLALAYLLAMWTIAQSGDRQQWVARRTQRQRERQAAGQDDAQAPPPSGDEPIQPLVTRLAIGGAVILVSGFLLSQTGEAIAGQTGLGNSFVGAVFVAIATSLPETSSVVSSMRRRRYEMALSDIFGTNLYNILLLFLVDLLYRGGPALNEVGRFSLVGSLLGALLAAIFLVGLIERRDRTVARMGVDSLAVLVCYCAGLYLLYQLR
jgi:cation:H+ antiporter